jgi:hypothetical protein
LKFYNFHLIFIIKKKVENFTILKLRNYLLKLAFINYQQSWPGYKKQFVDHIIWKNLQHQRFCWKRRIFLWNTTLWWVIYLVRNFKISQLSCFSFEAFLNFYTQGIRVTTKLHKTRKITPSNYGPCFFYLLTDHTETRSIL